MLKARTKTAFRALKRKADAGQIESIERAAATVRLVARRSIRRSKKAGPPGQPHRTRRGQSKRALAYEVERARKSAVIGPKASEMGQSAKAHEFGGQFRGDSFDKRPVMGPALKAVEPRLTSFWANSVR